MAFLPTIALGQHYVYYSGGYDSGNYGWHILPLFFVVLIPVLWFMFCLAMFVFWIMMLIDAIKHAPEKMKIVWVIVIIFTSLIGALIYYFVERRPRMKGEHKKAE